MVAILNQTAIPSGVNGGGPSNNNNTRWVCSIIYDHPMVGATSSLPTAGGNLCRNVIKETMRLLMGTWLFGGWFPFY